MQFPSSPWTAVEAAKSFSRVWLCVQPSRLPRPWDSPGKNTGVGCHFLLQCVKVKSESEVTQSCLTLSDLMDCSLPGSSAHGIFQVRVLELGAISFSAPCMRFHKLPHQPTSVVLYTYPSWYRVLFKLLFVHYILETISLSQLLIVKINASDTAEDLNGKRQKNLDLCFCSIALIS